MGTTTERRPVCVLGVGRSGTSLATRVLNILGVDLGPQHAMLASNDWNPEGFWELEALNALNDDILEALGGSLWSPPSPAPGWEDRSELAPLRARAQALVREMFPDNDRWGFKDPRTIHTLPLWRRVVGPMDYVLCVRNPMEVVESLRTKLTDRSTEELYAIWVQGNCQAIRLTYGEPRCFVFYEDWLADPTGTAGRLGDFLGTEFDARHEAGALAGVFDERLHRRRAGLDALVSGAVPVEAAALHLLLRQLAAAEASDAPTAAPLQAVASRLDAGLILASAVDAEREREREERRAIDARLDEFERERTALLNDREWLRERLEELQAAHDASIRELVAERDWLRERLAEVQAAHDTAVTALPCASQELARARAEANSARAALAVVEGSQSWRLTAPLRAAKRWLLRR